MKKSVFVQKDILKEAKENEDCQGMNRDEWFEEQFN